MEDTSKIMNSEVDVNILIKNYHSKLSSLINQNILLESKYESLQRDYAKLKNQLDNIGPNKYQEAGIEE
jgi:hypothetical protein